MPSAVFTIHTNSWHCQHSHTLIFLMIQILPWSLLGMQHVRPIRSMFFHTGFKLSRLSVWRKCTPKIYSAQKLNKYFISYYHGHHKVAIPLSCLAMFKFILLSHVYIIYLEADWINIKEKCITGIDGKIIIIILCLVGNYIIKWVLALVPHELHFFMNFNYDILCYKFTHK